MTWNSYTLLSFHFECPGIVWVYSFAVLPLAGHAFLCMKCKHCLTAKTTPEYACPPLPSAHVRLSFPKARNVQPTVTSPPLPQRGFALGKRNFWDRKGIYIQALTRAVTLLGQGRAVPSRSMHSSSNTAHGQHAYVSAIFILFGVTS